MKKLYYLIAPFLAIILYDYTNLFHSLVEDSDGIVYSDVIETTTGPLRGFLVTDAEIGVKYYAYQGIPYAESPTGPLRFKPPLIKKPWSEVLNATKIGKACPQFELTHNKNETSEDCLFLNIYVPEKRSSQLAVLVMIHGGGFQFNPNREDPLHIGPHLFLVKHDIIVITLNFRLGILGYFCLDIEEATGNYQLKDIILALKWINANIDKFGGDNDKITLSGYSSGAVAIEFLMMTGKSKGLFQQALLFSGSPLGYKMFGRYPKQNSMNLAHELDIEIDDPYIILEKMKKIEPNRLIFADDLFAHYEDRRLLRRPTRFLPHIEIDSDHAVVTESPKKLLEKGKIHNIKVLMGMSEEESFCLYAVLNRYTIKEFNNDIERMIPSDIEYPKNSEQSRNLAKSIHSFYLNESEVTVKNSNQFGLMSGDAQFMHPIYDLLNYYKKFLNNNLYFYIYSNVHDLNVFSTIMKLNKTGMFHSDAFLYIYNSEQLRSKYKNKDLKAITMSQRLLMLTSNFIKYGDPTPYSYEGVKWPDYRKEKMFLEIGEELKVKSDFSENMKRRIEFWRNVYDDYEQYLRDGGPIKSKIVP